MKQVENRQNTLMKKVWQSWRRFWEEEDGMGTVEVILIIVEIFTI